ncbi:glycosyltransferase family 4 protein [Litorilinea aerophila]|uniref:Glycosyltransferase family 4 protein n=1 Tax=Litorilinea aerophila TaxID=1204385 RepID=A0A540VJR2_9CHLR|nr:glycosyltransferase family 4 protein [Litorilinea aerophila]MCC9075489.1 glycosyltransferase family 4 protein [Litorilinea aerophila]
MKVAIVTNVVPSYRLAFYQRLCQQPEHDFVLFCQDRLPGFNLALVHDRVPCKVERLAAWGSEHGVVWQRLPVMRLWRDFDVLVFYGNPRLLSTVLWATLFRWLGKPVIIWGQGHTAGAPPWTEGLRLRWWRQFDTILVYTDREAEALQRSVLAGRQVIGLNNGLDQDRIEQAIARWPVRRLTAWQQARGLEGRPVLLSCARLVEKNRFDLVPPLLARLRSRYPDLRWCVIGDGPAREALAGLVRAHQVEDLVVWVGALYDEEALAPWFLSARLLIHPGAIGLTLLHAFGYGLPVVTHGDLAQQMPEIAALEPGVNGLVFTPGDVASLAEAVRSLLDDPGRSRRMGQAAQEVVRTRFNVDVMVARFLQALAQTARQGQG